MTKQEAIQRESTLIMALIGFDALNWSSNYLVLRKGAEILLDESKKSALPPKSKSIFVDIGLKLSSVSILLLACAMECLIKGI